MPDHTILEEHNTRKARRDKRRVPRLTEADIPPMAELPTTKGEYWNMVGRDKQVGREQCIAEGKHALVREERGFLSRKHMHYTVFCGRCGEYAGTVADV